MFLNCNIKTTCLCIIVLRVSCQCWISINAFHCYSVWFLCHWNIFKQSNEICALFFPIWCRGRAVSSSRNGFWWIRAFGYSTFHDLSVLAKYDPEELVYIGAKSESHLENHDNTHRMAFTGQESLLVTVLHKRCPLYSKLCIVTSGDMEPVIEVTY